MKLPISDRTAERLITLVLAVVLIATAWLALISGELPLRGRSAAVAASQNQAGIITAAAFLLFALVPLGLFLRTFSAGRAAYLIMAALVLGPPIVYVFAR